MKLVFKLAALTIYLGVLSPSSAQAHDARPVVVHIQESAAGVRTEWRVPRVNSLPAAPELVMPERCSLLAPLINIPEGDSLRIQGTWNCGGSIGSEDVSLTYPVFNPGLSTLFRAELLTGETYSRLLPPGKETWTIPASEKGSGIALDFTLMGIRHILFGLDHLLFAFCLMLIAGTPRRILMTVTGFTVAHAITLGLSSAGFIHLPNQIVEAAIALSIAFAAAEIARGNRTTLTYRYPVLTAMTFGLLHGFGFASVLRQTGLPQTRALLGLLSFNVGVELGQLAFISFTAMLMLTGRFLVSRSETRLHRMLGAASLETGIAYAVGIVATFWTMQRLWV